MRINLDLAPTIQIGTMHPELELNEHTWIISDTHFGHTNIIRYCDRPYNHDSVMLKHWEANVQPNDYILHLGDVTIWHKYHAYWARQMKELPGKKFLIIGNHDEQWTIKQWKSRAGFTVCEPFVHNFYHEFTALFSHEAAAPSAQWDVNIHGHSHNHAPFRMYSKLQTLYYNVSVEATDYKPVRLGAILNEIRS